MTIASTIRSVVPGRPEIADALHDAIFDRHFGGVPRPVIVAGEPRSGKTVLLDVAAYLAGELTNEHNPPEFDPLNDAHYEPDFLPFLELEAVPEDLAPNVDAFELHFGDVDFAAAARFTAGAANNPLTYYQWHLARHTTLERNVEKTFGVDLSLLLPGRELLRCA